MPQATAAFGPAMVEAHRAAPRIRGLRLLGTCFGRGCARPRHQTDAPARPATRASAAPAGPPSDDDTSTSSCRDRHHARHPSARTPADLQFRPRPACRRARRAYRHAAPRRSLAAGHVAAARPHAEPGGQQRTRPRRRSLTTSAPATRAAHAAWRPLHRDRGGGQERAMSDVECVVVEGRARAAPVMTSRYESRPRRTRPIDSTPGWCRAPRRASRARKTASGCSRTTVLDVEDAGLVLPSQTRDASDAGRRASGQPVQAWGEGLRFSAHLGQRETATASSSTASARTPSGRRSRRRSRGPQGIITRRS